jgi:hypothetical protein
VQAMGNKVGVERLEMCQCAYDVTVHVHAYVHVVNLKYPWDGLRLRGNFH